MNATNEINERGPASPLGGRGTPRRLLPVLLATAAFSAAGSMQAGEIRSCFDFFDSLPPGVSGSCADVLFFGFDGTAVEILECAGTGSASANLDLFDDIPLLPDFFGPEEPVLSSVEVKSVSDANGVTEFTIEHRGRIAMFPFSAMPPVGTPDISRFFVTGSESRVAFHVSKPGALGNVPIEIELDQDFEFIDPPANQADGELGTFFLVELEDIDDEILIDELVGTSTFDSALDPEPIFDDPFAPGYDGFTTTTTPAPGVAAVEYSRTLDIDIELDIDLSLTTLASESIISDGFESGDISAWSVDSGNTFTFRVSSPDPDVRFVLNLDTTPALTVPLLAVSRLSATEVRLTWDALDTQSYTILFTPDLALPHAQWEERGTVSATAGQVMRDFTITGELGFFALRVGPAEL